MLGSDIAAVRNRLPTNKAASQVAAILNSCAVIAASLSSDSRSENIRKERQIRVGRATKGTIPAIGMRWREGSRRGDY